MDSIFVDSFFRANDSFSLCEAVCVCENTKTSLPPHTIRHIALLHMQWA